MSTVAPPVPQKPVPPPANSAAPGATAPARAKRPKIVKTKHPIFVDDTVKLDKAPEDYDYKKHSPLTRKDFKDDSFFMDHQAGVLELKAARLRKQATKIRSLGANASNAKAKKLLQMQERMAELMAALKGEGVDVDTLLKKE